MSQYQWIIWLHLEQENGQEEKHDAFSLSDCFFSTFKFIQLDSEQKDSHVKRTNDSYYYYSGKKNQQNVRNKARSPYCFLCSWAFARHHCREVHGRVSLSCFVFHSAHRTQGKTRRNQCISKTREASQRGRDREKRLECYMSTFFVRSPRFFPDLRRLNHELYDGSAPTNDE